MAFFEAFGLSFLSTRRKGNYMHHRGGNERKVRTFGFYDLSCVVTSEGDVKSISDIVFEDSDALHSTADHFLNNMEGNGARITQLTEAESRA